MGLNFLNKWIPKMQQAPPRYFMARKRNPEHNPLLKKGLLAKRRSKTFGPYKNKKKRDYNKKHKNNNNKNNGNTCSLSLKNPKNSISCFFSNLLN